MTEPPGPQTLEADVAQVGTQGDGLVAGHYVAGVLPGERVRIRPVAPGRAHLASVLAPAPARVVPVCPHAGPCGGCTLQHADDRWMAAWKTERLVEALAAAGVVPGAVRPAEPGAPHRRRRVALSARRGRKGAIIGFHARGGGEIVPVERCPVAVPAIEAALPRLAPLVMALASRKGALRLTLTAAAAGLDLAVEGAKPLDGPLRARLPAMARAAGVVRLAVAGDTVVEAAPPTHRLGAARVLPPPGAFLQPTLEGAAALTAAVVEALAPSLGRGARVADLFAGIGTFALPLAGHAAVHAVEVDGGALAALDRGWRGAAGQGLSRITTERRNLMRRPLLADELAPFDAVVIDPPYAGAETQARALAASTVPRIASVSCNPASFARDAAILAAGGYRLAWVQPVDQFFWSAHVEVVGAFERA